MHDASNITIPTQPVSQLLVYPITPPKHRQAQKPFTFQGLWDKARIPLLMFCNNSISSCLLQMFKTPPKGRLCLHQAHVLIGLCGNLSILAAVTLLFAARPLCPTWNGFHPPSSWALVSYATFSMEPALLLRQTFGILSAFYCLFHDHHPVQAIGMHSSPKDCHGFLSSLH